MPVYAHSVEGRPESEWERLDTHLHNVAERARAFGAPLGLGDLAYAAGLLHDLGKTSREFQARLRGDPTRVDHATAGAKTARHDWPAGPVGKMVAYAIAGHHAGLPDWADLAARCARDDLPVHDPAFVPRPAQSPKLPFHPDKQGLSRSLLIRIVFSCLVDADFLETERFLDPETPARRGRRPTPADLIPRLEAKLNDLGARAEPSPLDADRRAVQNACRDAAASPPGLFKLTVPTGGGKTLASLLFALHHAQAHGLRRVIVAIPYTSIIEQTAATFREVLGAEAVLEHHSGPTATHNGPATERSDGDRAEDADDQGRKITGKAALDAQNWDAPVVVTTNVQLFESLFAARPARCRKLHAIPQSVIVLDEAQVLPVAYLKPCMAVLRELTRHYGASAVLCTATQPALDKSDWLPDGLEGVQEIAPDPDGLHTRFRRVDVREIGPRDDATLADDLAAREQVLCIVDSRAHAAALVQAVKARAGAGEACFHLSARMCPAHRRETLATIKARLAEGAPCRVVSTQLIEAGVDVDFPAVFRALAGLDSLAQAAGRCNRERRAERGTLHVFRSDRESRLPDWRRRITCARAVLDSGADPLSPAAQRAFFQRLYDVEDLDAKGIVKRLGEGARKLEIPFRTVAEAFRFIDSPTQPVVVPYDETARARIETLRHCEAPGQYARALDPYTVQVYPGEIAALRAKGAISHPHEGFAVLDNADLYDPDLGLCVEEPTYRSVESSIV